MHGGRTATAPPPPAAARTFRLVAVAEDIWDRPARLVWEVQQRQNTCWLPDLHRAAGAHTCTHVAPPCVWHTCGAGVMVAHACSFGASAVRWCWVARGEAGRCLQRRSKEPCSSGIRDPTTLLPQTAPHGLAEVAGAAPSAMHVPCDWHESCESTLTAGAAGMCAGDTMPSMLVGSVGVVPGRSARTDATGV